MKIFSTFTLAACALLFSLTASATPTLQTFGVNGSTAVFNCPWNQAHTDCSWNEFTSYSGSGVTTATATSVHSLASDIRGTALVTGEINPSSYLPSLHAYAYSNPAATGTPGLPYGGSSRADANVWGVQGYQYVGDAPFLLTLTATLDSVFSSPDRDRLGNHSGFGVSLFDSAGYTFGYDSMDVTWASEVCPIMSAAPRGGYCAGMPTVYAIERQTLQDTGTISATISHLLTPGEVFYVGAWLDASVCCGATVDSSHTLNMAFNDASLLQSSLVPGIAAAVPEPGSLLLMTAGGLPLLLRGRARRSGRRGQL